MKKSLILFIFLLSALCLQSATYRTYVGHTLSGNTYTVYVNSDTAFGEDLIGQICYTPNGGGPTQYSGFQYGAFGTSVPGANWSVVITLPAGATNQLLELANENEMNVRYGYTNCVISLNNVLPVTLTQFKAQKSGSSVVLQWATATERNNDKFVVERSITGDIFESIGDVQGAGNSVSSKQYRFEDKTPQNGLNYYRLRQVDFDGTTEVSNILKVNMDKRQLVFSVYPNPVVEDAIFIEFTETDAPTFIRLHNVQGRLLREWNFEAQDGMLFPLDLTGLPTGNLFLQVNGTDSVVLVR